MTEEVVALNIPHWLLYVIGPLLLPWLARQVIGGWRELQALRKKQDLAGLMTIEACDRKTGKLRQEWESHCGNCRQDLAGELNEGDNAFAEIKAWMEQFKIDWQEEQKKLHVALFYLAEKQGISPEDLRQAVKANAANL